MPAVNWVNNEADTIDESFVGTITVGQGDIGIDAAAYSFAWTSEVQIPRDATMEILVPAGFGYQFKTGSTSRTTIETGLLG